MASLRRISDNAGDGGSMSQALDPATGKVVGSRPTLGCRMRVGSPFARTMQWQDYWTTTPVTEILEDTGSRVRFKTQNSEYEWRE